MRTVLDAELEMSATNDGYWKDTDHVYELHMMDDPELCNPPSLDMGDPRLTSKCRRLRREARGW